MTSPTLETPTKPEAPESPPTTEMLPAPQPAAKAEPAPAPAAAPTIDWSKVKPEDVPLRLIDQHPSTRELTRRLNAAQSDVGVLHGALRKFGNLASGMHSSIELLEDVNQLALARLSMETRAALGIDQRPPAAPRRAGRPAEE